MQHSTTVPSPAEDQLAEFVSVVLADTEDTWDTIFKEEGGHVVPDSFTHGSSEQRVHWFREGLNKGSVQGCNTFGSS